MSRHQARSQNTRFEYSTRLILVSSGIQLEEDVSIIRLKHLLGMVCFRLVREPQVPFDSCSHDSH